MIGADTSPGAGQVAGKWCQDADAIAERARDMQSSAQETDDGNSHGETRALDTRIERVGLDHRIEAVFRSPNNFGDDGRRFKDVMKAVGTQGLSLDLVNLGS